MTAFKRPKFTLKEALAEKIIPMEEAALKAGEISQKTNRALIRAQGRLFCIPLKLEKTSPEGKYEDR